MSFFDTTLAATFALVPFVATPAAAAKLARLGNVSVFGIAAAACAVTMLAYQKANEGAPFHIATTRASAGTTGSVVAAVVALGLVASMAKRSLTRKAMWAIAAAGGVSLVMTAAAYSSARPKAPTAGGTEGGEPGPPTGPPAPPPPPGPPATTDAPYLGPPPKTFAGDFGAV